MTTSTLLFLVATAEKRLSEIEAVGRAAEAVLLPDVLGAPIRESLSAT